MIAFASIAPAVAEPDRPGRAVHLQADRLAGGQQLGAELDRLSPRPVGELAAGHPVGEAQVVLDPRGLPRAWPPVAYFSTSTVRSPSEAP